MKKIKSFIYLDNYKMYSISSQLFEGLTEYMVKSKGKNYSEGDSQKGKVGSGRLMADILEEYTNHTVKKFLHDYSYNLFEEELLKADKVLTISADSIENQVKSIEEYHFVKVTGQTVFNDSKMLADTMRGFNDYGAAIGSLTFQSEKKQLDNIENTVNKIKDRNKKAKAKKQFSKNTFKNYLIEQGLNLEDEQLEHFAYLISYGYKDQFEVQIPFPSKTENYLFSTILNREYLKDSEYSILRKYSRETEKPFTIFGILTQTTRNIDEETKLEELKRNIDIRNTTAGKQSNVKEAILNLIPKLTGIDKGFIGRLDYEYIIDPIAIYREL